MLLRWASVYLHVYFLLPSVMLFFYLLNTFYLQKNTLQLDGNYIIRSTCNNSQDVMERATSKTKARRSRFVSFLFVRVFSSKVYRFYFHSFVYAQVFFITLAALMFFRGCPDVLYKSNIDYINDVVGDFPKHVNENLEAVSVRISVPSCRQVVFSFWKKQLLLPLIIEPTFLRSDYSRLTNFAVFRETVIFTTANLCWNSQWYDNNMTFAAASKTVLKMGRVVENGRSLKMAIRPKRPNRNAKTVSLQSALQLAFVIFLII